MIKGTFKRNQADEIISYEMSGHADTAPYGSDIVCAAVSALTFNTFNSIEELANFIPIHDIDDVNEGYFYFEIISELTEEQLMIAQILLNSLLIGLQNIQKEYPDVIEIITLTKK